MKPLKLTSPYLLVVVGVPGSGKTFFAKQFSQTYGAPFVDYGHFHSIAQDEHLGDVVATELLGQLFLTRSTILIEGRGETKQDRAILANLAEAKRYKLLYVWVQTEPQTTLRRAVQAKDATYSRSEYDSRVASFTLLDRQEPQVVISGKHTFSSQARMVLKRLETTTSEPQQAAAAAPKPVVTRPPMAVKKSSGRIIIGEL